MKTIDVEKIMAARRVSIPVPEDGGVVVLRGRNGTGKSTTLDAVDKLMKRPSGSLEPTDGHDKGSVEGLGVKMTVGRSTRYSGELEVVSLDAKLSIADLVEPGIIDPEAADAKRMKSLLAILQVRADGEVWRGLAAHEAEWEILEKIADESPDVLTAAAKIKRHYEQNARLCETTVAEEQKQLDKFAPECLAEQKPAEPPSDDELAAALKAANDAVTALAARKSRAEGIAGARAAIDELKGELCNELAANTEIARLTSEIDVLQFQLQNARDSLAAHTRTRDASIKARTEIDRLQKSIECDAPPTDEEVAAAESAADAARKNMSACMKLRSVIAGWEHAHQIAAKIAKQKEYAESFRAQAAKTDGVLASLVGNRVKGMTFDGGRMLYKHPDRGLMRYADLSHGERSLIACAALIDGLGAGGLATLPQEFWEGLDPQNRAKIDAMAQRTGVVLITAECSDDAQLTAETFSG
jgi:energy-coupling factor transporter ATP-binding protein EcfA2